MTTEGEGRKEEGSAHEAKFRRPEEGLHQRHPGRGVGVTWFRLRRGRRFGRRFFFFAFSGGVAARARGGGEDGDGFRRRFFHQLGGDIGRLVGGQELTRPCDFCLRRLAAQRAPVEPLQRCLFFEVRGAQYRLGQRQRLLEHEGGVEQEERLRRHRGSIAAPGDQRLLHWV